METGTDAEGGAQMKLRKKFKEEFYKVMLAKTAGIYHDSLHLDFVLADGQVKEILLDGEPIPERKET